MTYLCTSCDIRFEAAEPRCPSCLRRSPVVDPEAPRPHEDAADRRLEWSADEAPPEPAFIGLRALITLAMLLLTFVGAYAGIALEDRLKASGLVIGWFGGLLLFGRFAIVFGFRVREFTGEHERLTERKVLEAGALCFAGALLAGLLFLGSSWLAATIVGLDENPMAALFLGLAIFLVALFGLVFVGARLPRRLREGLGLMRRRR